MNRPYEVMLHSPGIAQPMAELGGKIRYESTLSDHDRELVIVTAAVAHGCAFEWDSHHRIAVERHRLFRASVVISPPSF